MLNAQPLKSVFPPANLIEVSVYYYPEHWARNEWERDIKNIAAMGFEYVHLTDHAWQYLEPKEDVFSFGWVDTCIELAAKYGMKTLLSTPTSAPPVWLNEKYPECLMVDDAGIVQRHASRQNYSWSSDKMRSFTERIVDAMGKHFGKNTNVIGWQIDNEPSHYGQYDYSYTVRQSFIKWLTKKYGTISNLNKVWGNAFWAMNYESFNQIRIPNERELIQNPNPHALLDFKRFTAEECASYISLQYQVLKRNTLPNQWITTNFMSYNENVNPQLNNDLDLVSYTMYPVSGYNDGVGTQGFRMGSPYNIAFANDFFRPISGSTGCMELQPGQVNWGIYNYQPLPGAIRMWLWHCYAGGCDYISSYRYRQPLFGMEQYHYGMVNTDGVTPTRGGLEYQQFIKEIKELRTIYKPANSEMPDSLKALRTAFLYSFDNLWNMNYLKQTNDWNSNKHFQKYFGIAKKMALPVDVITEKQLRFDYPFIVAPAYQLVNDNLISWFKEYVNKGGHLVLTVRSGQKDREAHFPETPFAQSIEELIGAKVAYYDVLSKKHIGHINSEGKQYTWTIWGDILAPKKNTKVWGRYTDQFYKDSACIVHRKLGKGSVTYIGVDTEDGLVENDIMKKVYTEAKRNINILPEGVMMEFRDGFYIVVNYSSEFIELNVPAGDSYIFGGPTLKPAEIAVLRKPAKIKP